MSDKDAKATPPPLTQGQAMWRLLPLMLLTTWLCSRGPSKDPASQMQECGKHLHTIGVSLEKFRLTGDDGLYPKTLEEAFKGKTVPVCPVGGKDTYLTGYQPAADQRSYLLVCKGDHHKEAGVPPDYPRIAFGPAEASASGEESAVQGSPSPLPQEQGQEQEGRVVEASPSSLPQAPASPAAASATPNP